MLYSMHLRPNSPCWHWTQHFMKSPGIDKIKVNRDLWFLSEHCQYFVDSVLQYQAIWHFGLCSSVDSFWMNSLHWEVFGSFWRQEDNPLQTSSVYEDEFCVYCTHFSTVHKFSPIVPFQSVVHNNGSYFFLLYYLLVQQWLQVLLRAFWNQFLNLQW